MSTRWISPAWVLTASLLTCSATVAAVQKKPDSAGSSNNKAPAARTEDAPATPTESTAPAAKPGSAAQRPWPVRFQATVYQVDLPVDQMATLDAKVLADKATTATTFDAALKTIGTVKPLYRVDQSIDLRSGSQVSLMARVPFTAGVANTPGGKTTTVTREQLGAKFAVRSSLDEDSTKGRLPVWVTVEISAQTDSSVDSGGVPAKIDRQVQQTNGGSVTLGIPMVLISADAAAADSTPDKLATAFITQIILSGD